MKHAEKSYGDLWDRSTILKIALANYLQPFQPNIFKPLSCYEPMAMHQHERMLVYNYSFGMCTMHELKYHLVI